MDVVGRGLLEEFCTKHTDVRSQVNAWIADAENSEWRTPQDIKARYAHASFLADNRVVFNLKGNRYRLDVKVAYRNHVVFVKRIGTHTEYESWKF